MEKEQRYFPFFVDISEYRVLVVGAGIIALRRTSALLRFGTRVTVVAPDIRAEFQALQAQYGQEYVCLQQKKFTPGMTTGYDIVLAATDSPKTDHSIWEECKKHGIRVSVASDQTLCDFRFPASLWVLHQMTVITGMYGRSVPESEKHWGLRTGI